MTIFALLLFSAIGFSPGKVKSDIGHSEFRVEYVLGSKMLLYRFLTVSVFCDDTLRLVGELAERKILHIHEQYGIAATCLFVWRCLWSSGIPLLGNCAKEDQVHPIRGFGFSRKRTLILFTNAMFSCLHGKINVNVEKIFTGFPSII